MVRTRVASPSTTDTHTVTTTKAPVDQAGAVRYLAQQQVEVRFVGCVHQLLKRLLTVSVAPDAVARADFRPSLDQQTRRGDGLLNSRIFRLSAPPLTGRTAVQTSELTGFRCKLANNRQGKSVAG